MPSDQITLNIGGRAFTTSKSTLILSGSGYFHGRFTTGETLAEGAHTIFIDRDGLLFDDILFFMRSGSLRAKTRITPTTLVDLAAEAEFYVYGDLAEACQVALRNLKTSLVEAVKPRPSNAKFHALIVSSNQYKRLRVPEGAVLYIATATLAGRCRVVRYNGYVDDPTPCDYDKNNPGCYLMTTKKEDTGDFQLYLSTSGISGDNEICIAHAGMDQFQVSKRPVRFDFRHDLRITALPSTPDRRVLLGALGSGDWHVSCWIGRPEDIPGLMMTDRTKDSMTANLADRIEASEVEDEEDDIGIEGLLHAMSALNGTATVAP